MALSGPEALRSLDEALRDIRRDEDEIARRLARSAELVSKMREQEGELLRSLAEVRLDPAAYSGISDVIAAAEREARDMLKVHAEALDDGERKLAAIDADIAKSAAERARLQTEAAARDSELRALAERVRPSLSQDAEYMRKRDEAAAAAAVADESLRKLLQSEADREQKGRPYRDDPLFMYLWSSGYGTDGYRANKVVAWLDGMVARLVGFADVRPNFALLNDIPLRLREHAEQQEQLAAAAQDALVAYETDVIDAAGGMAARQAMETVVGKVEAIDQAIMALQDQRDEMLRAQRELAQGSDPAFARAMAGLADVLGRASLRSLLAEARSAPTPEHDAIVRQIDEARQRRDEEEDDAAEQKTRLKALASRRRELEDIQLEFKRQGFDNPRSTFGDESLVGDRLNEFLRGAISATSYWDRWRRSQNWNVAPSENGSAPDRPRAGDDQRTPWGQAGWADNAFAGLRRTPGYGGPGGGWGRISSSPSGSGVSLSGRRRGASIDKPGSEGSRGGDSLGTVKASGV